MDKAEAVISYSKTDSWKIFDAIYQRYDLANRVLSLGMDVSWRKRFFKYLPARDNIKALDLATGTADVVISLVQNSSDITSAYGIDLSENMLALGRKKIAAKDLQTRIQLQKADAAHLPFPDNEFDLETMAFGIRNVENPIFVLKEIYRTLKPGGRGVVLEFSLPANFFIRIFYLIYLKVLVPLVGGVISGNFSAYFYLNRTIEKFPHGEVFCRMMRQCGFKNVTAEPLLFGVATIYCGEKT